MLTFNEDMAMKVGIWVKLLTGSAIGFLFLYQFNNALYNLTTVEDTMPQMEDQNPFDKGSFIKNMEDIFGPFSIAWFLPLKPRLPREHQIWNTFSKIEYSSGYASEDI